jgi:hypothetical protein
MVPLAPEICALIQPLSRYIKVPVIGVLRPNQGAASLPVIETASVSVQTPSIRDRNDDASAPEAP